jgi:plastocyanin
VAGLASVVLVASVAALGGACGDGGSNQATPTSLNGDGSQLQIWADDSSSFNTDALQAPADEPFAVTFDNRDTGVYHNFALYESEDDAGDTDKAIAASELESGPDTQTVEVPALPPGEYYFQCDLHPNMRGTLTVG